MLKGHKPEFSGYSDFYIIENEADLRNRILKAINHLSTFCVDKKQTFNH